MSGYDNLWTKAQNLNIRTGPDIAGGFDVGFDAGIPGETRDQLMRFVYWVEDHYHLPVTLWVDFKYRHYLITRDKKRVGFRFYWADFATWPEFTNWDDLPVIELPVRTERSSMKAILASFIEAITYYFAWLSHMDCEHFETDDALTDRILREYLESAGGETHA